MAPSQPCILIALLRNDLRIVDHPIFHAAHSGSLGNRVTHILPVYVFDERQIELSGIQGYSKAAPNKFAKTPIAGFWKCNVHRTKFLHESLVDLKQNLEKRGSALSVFFGHPERVVPAIVKAYTDKGMRVEGVWIGRENTNEEIQTQKKLQQALEKIGAALQMVESRRTMIHPDDLPFDPTGKQMPDFYTAFRQKVEGLRDEMVRPPFPAPDKFKPPPTPITLETSPGIMQRPSSLSLPDILPQLLQPIESEETKCPEDRRRKQTDFKGGMTAGEKRLNEYMTGPNAALSTYKETRNGLLGYQFSTKFSPWLANGSLSPKVIFQKILEWEDQHGSNKSSYWVKFELLWRDYFSFLIEKHKNKFFFLSGLALPQQEAPVDSGNPPSEKRMNKNGKETIDGYWVPNDMHKGEQSDVAKWCYGKTGVPFIDANMREITQTGFMSNRGRQNVASFFTKDMGHQDWRIGAEYFESMLMDYDVTSNYGNWQYQAGVGVDPRSARQFNIIKQGKDYDPKGEYVAHWVPELAEVLHKHQVPPGAIHHPWTVQAINSDLRAGKTTSVYATPHFEQKAWISHYRREGQNEENKRGGQGGKRGHSRAKEEHMRKKQDQAGPGQDTVEGR